jgi:hypothetical protein
MSGENADREGRTSRWSKLAARAGCRRLPFGGAGGHSKMSRRLVLAALFLLGTISTGCSPGTPASWSVTIDQLQVQPAAPTADTPVSLEFRVTCRRTGGSGSVPVPLIAEACRADTPAVITERVSCSVGGQHEPGVFVGYGHADLGKLPAGKHSITVSLHAKGAGCSMPPPQGIDVAVAAQ